MKKIEWRDICAEDEKIHLAYLKLDRRSFAPKHHHDFYECFLVESGKGKHEIKGKSYDLKRGDMYFMQPEDVHCVMGNGTRPLTIINLAVEEQCFIDICRIIPELRELWDKASLTSKQFPGLTQSFREVVTETSLTSNGALEASHLLSQWLILTKKDGGSLSDLKLPDWLSTALSEVRHPDNLRIGLPKLFSLCHKSPEHVSRVFSQKLQMSPSCWLGRERINWASRLLKTTQMNILEISLECGFESSSYFHRTFKKWQQCTPFQFRKDLAQVQGRS